MENFLHSAALHQDRNYGHTIREGYEEKSLVDYLQSENETDYIQKSILTSIFTIFFSSHWTQLP